MKKLRAAEYAGCAATGLLPSHQTDSVIDAVHMHRVGKLPF